jgi:iron-sulfur cluster repair protein YtfE (RIC family)
MSHLDAMVDSADSETFIRAQRLLRLKRQLAAHAMAEEDVVYPTLCAGAENVESASQLYNEHAEMKVLLYKLEQTPKDDAQWHLHASELRTLVERHIRQEEEIDFPRLRAALDEADCVELAAKIEREKALLL